MWKSPRHKFNAIRTEYNGFNYSSKAEARYAAELDLRIKAKDVVFYLKQTPFHLPGGIKYVCDFQVFLSDGTVEFVDVKGMSTLTFKAKKKMVEAIYPVTIQVVK